MMAMLAVRYLRLRVTVVACRAWISILFTRSGVDKITHVLGSASGVGAAAAVIPEGAM